MNFDEAMTAHSKWKTRLRMCIDGQEKLDPAEVGKDSACVLGQWIYGEGGRSFGSQPEFAQLKAEHANFHKAAADVVKKANSGDKAGAEASLSGAYSQISTKVVSMIMQCKKKFGG